MLCETIMVSTASAPAQIWWLWSWFELTSLALVDWVSAAPEWLRPWLKLSSFGLCLAWVALAQAQTWRLQHPHELGGFGSSLSLFVWALTTWP